MPECKKLFLGTKLEFGTLSCTNNWFTYSSKAYATYNL